MRSLPCSRDRWFTFACGGATLDTNDRIETEMPRGAEKPDVLALAAVGVTLAVHLAVKLASNKPSVSFIAGASLFWAIFVIVRARQDKDVFSRWGFQRQNLSTAAAASAVLFCIGAAAMATIAVYQKNLAFPLHM